MSIVQNGMIAPSTTPAHANAPALGAPWAATPDDVAAYVDTTPDDVAARIPFPPAPRWATTAPTGGEYERALFDADVTDGYVHFDLVQARVRMERFDVPGEIADPTAVMLELVDPDGHTVRAQPSAEQCRALAAALIEAAAILDSESDLVVLAGASA